MMRSHDAPHDAPQVPLEIWPLGLPQRRDAIRRAVPRAEGAAA
jgi:hypothetical protein